MKATNWEFTNRALVFGLIFGFAFPLYFLDHQNSTAMLANWLGARLQMDADLPARLLDRGVASRADPGAGCSGNAAGRAACSLGGPRTDPRLALPAPRRRRSPRRLPSAGRLCSSGPARRSGLGAVALRASPAMTRGVRLTQACLAGLALGSLLVGVLPPRSYNKDLQQ